MLILVLQDHTKYEPLMEQGIVGVEIQCHEVPLDSRSE